MIKYRVTLPDRILEKTDRIEIEEYCYVNSIPYNQIEEIEYDILPDVQVSPEDRLLQLESEIAQIKIQLGL